MYGVGNAYILPALPWKCEVNLKLMKCQFEMSE